MTQANVLAAAGSPGVSTGFRNRIINGSMVIDQRNNGALVNPAVAGICYPDRWYYNASQASKFSVGQNAGSVTPPVGFTNYLGYTSLSAYSIGAGDTFYFSQKIEGFNVADLGWGTTNAKTITFSAWVYSSLTGTFGGALRNSAGNRSYPFTYSIPVANTWTQISITIAGDTTGTWLTNNGIGIELDFNLGTGSTLSGTAGAWAGANYVSATGATSVVGTNGATFYITGVQLEVGTTATNFDYRPYGTELALCQRYYQTINEWYIRTYQTSGAVFGQTITLETSMRAIPTMAIFGTPSYSNASGGTVASNFGFNSCQLYATASSTGDSRFSNGASNCYLTASAEL